nr:protein translocase subunit SecD [Rubrobacteraceae bacterium]
MGSTRNNLIVLGLVVVLIGVAAYLIFIRQPVTQSTQLGLDLQGGVSAQLEGSQTGGGTVSREEMEQASDLIRQRIDRLGVAEPDVRVQGQDQIVVQIPGVENPREVIDIIGQTAQLGFYQVLTAQEQAAVPDDEIQSVRNEIDENLRDDDAFEPGKTKVLFEESTVPGSEGTFVSGYVVREQPDLTGQELQQNGANVEFDSNNQRVVSLQLTSEGGNQMADLTQEMLNEEAVSGEPARLAIALDQSIQSAPQLQGDVLSDQISISNSGLPGGLPEDEARQLETVLNTGALPVNIEIISRTTVGPTLGLSSLRSGLIAALLGFALVLALLVIIYRALGVVAAIALLIYAFLMWGIIVAVPVTMTLPGIAGIVLSIGVAADANVVIFERIKEEVRRGRTPRAAIQAGYDRGFRAILDGNITTLITAFILFALSSGSVRGFAVLLVIGGILSMFTAVVVTRALLGLLSGRGVQLSPGMMGVSRGSVSVKRP